MKLLRPFIILLKVLAWALVIIVPTLGVWVASSLAAYLNGPIWLACLAGLLLFPALPLGWDIWATNRFYAKEESRKAAGKEARKRLVTFGDRMILRTFFLNIGFLAALLATFPQVGFTALATRGDWVLETTDSRTAKNLRPLIFSTAEGLAWLYELTLDNPYEQYQDDEPLPTPTADEFGDAATRPTETPDPPSVDPPKKPVVPDPIVPEVPDEPVLPVVPDPVEIVAVDEPVRKVGEAPVWPMKKELHALVADMPAAIETDYASVAAYILKNEPDAFLRVKALNDYVANRITYDHPALKSREFPPQDAKTVFDTKTGVCAGYARLLEAMGKVTGDEIVYVVGVSRDQDGQVGGIGHAWNAAKIEGKWYLVDTTWNDTADKYSTNYLFTPPAVFTQDHLPDAAEWQLRPDPITRGEFMRQPILPPEFYAHHLTLVAPQRSQIEARGTAVAVTLENPLGHRILASIEPTAGGQKTDCSVVGGQTVKISCPVRSGTSRLKVFAGKKDLKWYPFVAQFEVTAR